MSAAATAITRRTSGTKISSCGAGSSAGPARTSTRSCGEPCFHCKKASVHRKTPTNSPVCAILKKGRLSKRKQKAQNAKLPLDTGGGSVILLYRRKRGARSAGCQKRTGGFEDDKVC